MNVQLTTLNQFFSLNSVEFVIPVYQRNYAWQKTHCKRLLDDILDVADKKHDTHFFGTITYILHPNTQHFGNEYVIIDGQQRITTVMLLLKALQKKTKNEDLRDMIEKYLNFGSKDKAKLRLKPIKKDRDALDCVMNDKQFMGGVSNIVDNFRFFNGELNGALARGFEIEQIFNCFERLQIAVLSLEQNKGDDPQMVFERINATGLHLKGLDLIRNYLMMEHNAQEQEEIFERYWRVLEEILGEEKDGEKIITKFITVYLRIYYGASLKEDESKIYEALKELRKDNFNNDSKEILRDMVKFARIYKIIIDKNAIWSYEGEIPAQKREIREKLKYLVDLQFGLSFPLVMCLIDDFERQKLEFEDLNGILNLLISFFVRRAICSLSAAPLNKTIYGMYKKLNGEMSVASFARFLGAKSGSEIFPSDEMVRRNFIQMPIYKSRKIVSLVLYKIEQLTNREAPAPEQLNIEHFYPQTQTSLWREMVGDEFELLEREFIDTFGNLTLSDANLNSKIQNKSFEQKLKFYEDHGSLHLNRYFSNRDKCGISEIKSRANDLFQSFNKIEIFKDISNEFRRIEEKFTLANDLTGIKPRYVKFPNQTQKPINTIKELAIAIIEYLIANAPDELSKAINSGFGFIEFGTIEKGDGWICEDFGEFSFVCTASARTICANLRKLVEACEFEADEFEIMTI